MIFFNFKGVKRGLFDCELGPRQYEDFLVEYPSMSVYDYSVCTLYEPYVLVHNIHLNYYLLSH